MEAEEVRQNMIAHTNQMYNNMGQHDEVEQLEEKAVKKEGKSTGFFGGLMGGFGSSSIP